MWAVLKIDKDYSSIFKREFTKIMQSDVEIYSPKYLIQNFKNNKLKFKEIKLLGNYVFCFNSNLTNKNFFNRIKYLKGFKSYVPGFIETQKEITDFISNCKKFENKDGYIENNFFSFNLKNNYKFKTGIFTNRIFEIMKFQKNSIEIMIGNLKISAKKKNFLAQPV